MYENINFEEKIEAGGSEMSDIGGMGTGFVGGAIVGGLAGYALSRNNLGGAAGAVVAAEAVGGGCVNNRSCWSGADVGNIIATKDSEVAVIDTIQQTNINTCKGLASLAADLTAQNTTARIEAIQANNATNLLVVTSAKDAELCCCKTQGLIKETALQSQNFYLSDQVEQLRLEKLTSAHAGEINIINQNINNIAGVMTGVINTLSTLKVA